MRLFRIRIFQPVILEYRRGLYAGLWKRYGDRIEVWAAESLGVDKSVPLEGIAADYGYNFVRIGPFLWQRGLTLKGLAKGDVLVVCGELRQLSSLWYAACARLRGIRVVWWGHHASANAKEYKVRIRIWIAKWLSDVFLTYTGVGILYLANRGYPKERIFATGNTIDTRRVVSAINSLLTTNGNDKSKLEVFKQGRGFVGKHILLFCGKLREKVQLEVLLDALSLLKHKRGDWHCVIIGDGEMGEKWKALCKEHGLEPYTTWTGEILDQEELAPWFLSADIFVYPGRIGLSLIHAFSYGLPVILNDNPQDHGPEYIVFKPGENGISFKYRDCNDLALKIDESLSNPKISELGEKGKELVYREYSMEKMVLRYSAAVEAAASD